MYPCCTLRGSRPRETIILEFGIRKWRQAFLLRPTKTMDSDVCVVDLRERRGGTVGHGRD